MDHPGRSPVLTVDRLGVRYGSHTALEGVSFQVDLGELVAVVGPNGAGKSTLFKAIGGLVEHTGRIELGGVHCHHRADHMLAAYIPQRSDLDLDFPITVRQVVLAGRRRFLRLGQRMNAHHRAAAADALDRVGLGDLAGRPLGSLSGGQTQRVFLARALAQEAQLVVLDEALSGVDHARTESILDLFNDLRACGTTLLVATHDLALARRRFDRCLALNGRLVADGPPATSLHGLALEATFGSGSLDAVG